MRYFEIISQMTVEARNQFLTRSEGKLLFLCSWLEKDKLNKIMKDKGLWYSSTQELQSLAKETKGFGIRYDCIK